MPDSATTSLKLSRVGQQFLRMLPIALFVIAFGTAFGLASVQSGLSPWQSILMSATVFAGASQFASLELWGQSVSLIPLVAVVFAINSRHILMGATLYPQMTDLPAWQRYGLLPLLTDANWAMAIQDERNGRRNLEVIVGGGVALWCAWVGGTIVGVYFGGLLAEPERFGLDMVLGCFLLAMVLGGPVKWRTLVIWSVSAGSAMLSYWYLPEHTHVIIGALCGGVIGYLWPEVRHES